MEISHFSFKLENRKSISYSIFQFVLANRKSKMDMLYAFLIFHCKRKLDVENEKSSGATVTDVENNVQIDA